MAVAADERFRTVPGVRWHFWVVSNGLTDYARRMIQGGPDRNRRLVFKEDNIAVGVKTWGEIIEGTARAFSFSRNTCNTSPTRALRCDISRSAISGSWKE